jgi:hypothetical protein
MTHTVDTLMTLADAYATLTADTSAVTKAREALRTALMEALAQPVRGPLSEERIIELGHRIATKYTHRSDPTSHAYGFVKHTLVDFVRAIEKSHDIGGDK